MEPLIEPFIEPTGAKHPMHKTLQILSGVAIIAACCQLSPAHSQSINSTRQDYSINIANVAAYCVNKQGVSVELRQGKFGNSFEVLALVESNRPFMLVNVDALRRQPDWFQMFLFYRECGFHWQGKVKDSKSTSSPTYPKEVVEAADCFAIHATAKQLKAKLPNANFPNLIRAKMEERTSSNYPTSAIQLRRCVEGGS